MLFNFCSVIIDLKNWGSQMSKCLKFCQWNWNLKPIFTPKWASVDMNYIGRGSTPDNSYPEFLRQLLHYQWQRFDSLSDLAARTRTKWTRLHHRLLLLLRLLLYFVNRLWCHVFIALLPELQAQVVYRSKSNLQNTGFFNASPRYAKI